MDIQKESNISTTDYFVMKFEERELFILRTALSILAVHPHLDKIQELDILRLQKKLEKKLLGNWKEK